MTQWFILPGMGATCEMYAALRQQLRFDAHFPDWPDYRGEATFRDVARRIVAEHRITTKDIVAGSSLGGMIALEIFMMLQTKAVVLMGSALGTGEVNGWLSKLACLSPMTPFSMIQMIAAKHPHLLSRMYADCDAGFIRAMCAFVPSWPGYHGTQDKIHRLHGKRDHIISCPSDNCEIIQDAGHFLALSHTSACASFLNRVHGKVTFEN